MTSTSKFSELSKNQVVNRVHKNYLDIRKIEYAIDLMNDKMYESETKERKEKLEELINKFDIDGVKTWIVEAKLNSGAYHDVTIQELYDVARQFKIKNYYNMPKVILAKHIMEIKQ